MNTVAARDGATAFVSVDMDGLWALRRCYLQPEEDTLESDAVWREAMPALRELFAEAGISATFFLVGMDVQVPWKAALAREALAAGHALGNHSWDHDFRMPNWTRAQVLENVSRAQEAFARHVGIRPIGYRGPGYGYAPQVLQALDAAGIRYDSSLLPTPYAPLLRMVDWSLGRRVQWDKPQFGRASQALLERRPHRSQGVDVWEFPLAVSPTLRLPLGAGYTFATGPKFFRRAVKELVADRIPVSFLIHAADAVDLRRAETLVFPGRKKQPGAAGFALPGEEKRRRLREMLQILREEVPEIPTMEAWFDRVG